MYAKNLNNKMTLRLTDELKEYVDQMATSFGISPSDYIRQCIYQMMYSQKRATEKIDQLFDQDGIKEFVKALVETEKEKGGLANDQQTYSDDNV